MSEYYEHADKFDSELMETKLFDLMAEIRNILYYKVIKVYYTCENKDILLYEVLIEIDDNYLYFEGFKELNKFMKNSNYKFHSIFLSNQNHITLKYVR